MSVIFMGGNGFAKFDANGNVNKKHVKRELGNATWEWDEMGIEDPFL